MNVNVLCKQKLRQFWPCTGQSFTFFIKTLSGKMLAALKLFKSLMTYLSEEASGHGLVIFRVLISRKRNKIKRKYKSRGKWIKKLRESRSFN